MTSNLAEGITPGGGTSGGGGVVDEAAIRAIIVGYDYLTDPEVDIIVDMAGHVTAAEVHTLIANAPATGITQTQADAAIALAVANAGHASQVDLTAEILARESAASTIVSAPLTNTSLNMITAPGWYLSGAGNTSFPPAVTTVGLLRVVNTGGNTRRQDFYTGANDTPVKYSRIGTTTVVPGASVWTWRAWVHVLAVEDTGTTGQVLTSTGGSAAFADLPAETFSNIVGAVDLNTLIIPGRYATAGTTNHPVAADAGGTVIVERNAGADTGFIRQTYQATASFDTFSRYTFDITADPIVWLQWDEVNDRDVKNQHITTARLADGAVTEAKLADEAVTEDKLAQAVVDQLGGAGGVAVVTQAYNLYISNDSSNAAQAGTFPVTQITNYFPGYMNFTQVADGSVANPFTEATGITVTNTIANNTFPNIENVTSTAGIVLYAGVPIHIKASGGINLNVTSGLPSGVVLARVIRKVLLNGAEISSERTGGFRVRAGLVYLPFDELSYDFIPQADTPYNGSHVEYDLEFTNSTGARITTSQSLKYWLEPDTKEVITQLSPVLRPPRQVTEVELFRGNLRKQMFHSVQLSEAIPANVAGIRNVIEVSFDTANYDDATSTWNNDVGRARVPLIPVNARDLNEIDEYVLDGYAGVAGTFADFDCIPLITHTLGNALAVTESPTPDDSPNEQSVGVFLYRIRNAAGDLVLDKLGVSVGVQDTVSV